MIIVDTQKEFNRLTGRQFIRRKGKTRATLKTKLFVLFDDGQVWVS